MDFQGKAAYQRLDCPVCKDWKEKNKDGMVCLTCLKPMPQYVEPTGANIPVVINSGFDSAEIDHFHFKQDSTQAGQVIKKNECRECYLAGYNKKYPERNLTIDELPRTMELS